MGWKLRTSNDHIPPGKDTPDYGPNTEYFTIRMHHNGRFQTVDTPKYVEGKYADFDYCRADEMSRIELLKMAKLLGFNEFDHEMYVSACGDFNACTQVDYLFNDKHVMKMVKYVNDTRVVGVFIHSGNGNDAVTGDDTGNVVGETNVANGCGRKSPNMDRIATKSILTEGSTMIKDVSREMERCDL